MIQPVQAAARLRAVAESTDLPMAAMLVEVAELIDQMDHSALSQEQLFSESARLAAIVERLVSLPGTECPRYEDGLLRVWAGIPDEPKPIRRVYVIDAQAFDEAAAEAKGGESDG